MWYNIADSGTSIDLIKQPH